MRIGVVVVRAIVVEEVVIWIRLFVRMPILASSEARFFEISSSIFDSDTE